MKKKVAKPCFWCGRPGIRKGTGVALVADVLESDPEAEWTVNQLVAELHLARNTVQVSLARLRDAGVVEWRKQSYEGIWRWRGDVEGWRIVAVRE